MNEWTNTFFRFVQKNERTLGMIMIAITVLAVAAVMLSSAGCVIMPGSGGATAGSTNKVDWQKALDEADERGDKAAASTARAHLDAISSATDQAAAVRAKYEEYATWGLTALGLGGTGIGMWVMRIVKMKNKFAAHAKGTSRFIEKKMQNGMKEAEKKTWVEGLAAEHKRQGLGDDFHGKHIRGSIQ